MSSPLLSRNLSLTLIATALLIWTTAATTARAEAPRGLFLGANAGVASGVLSYSALGHDISEDALEGGLAGLRFGYAFSRKLALSLDGNGFNTTQNGADWEISSLVLALTWYPCGNGFYVRVGGGTGGGHITMPLTGRRVTLDNEATGLFAVGYDFRLSTHTSLGLAAEGLAIDANGATGFADDNVGAGALSLQFTWHL